MISAPGSTAPCRLLLVIALFTLHVNLADALSFSDEVLRPSRKSSRAKRRHAKLEKQADATAAAQLAEIRKDGEAKDAEIKEDVALNKTNEALNKTNEEWPKFDKMWATAVAAQRSASVGRQPKVSKEIGAMGRMVEKAFQPQLEPESYDVLFHLHIPKAAGMSFISDAARILQTTPHKLMSQEACYSMGQQVPNSAGTMTFLRRPINHVLSMYSFCNRDYELGYRNAVHQEGRPVMPARFRGWIESWYHRYQNKWHGDFTPPVHRVTPDREGIESKIRKSRKATWGEPPFVPEVRALSLQNWPVLDGGGTLWHMINMPYECYRPVNPQTQRMTCQKPLDFPEEEPSVELAIQNMNQTYFVGIVEAYQSSLCLLHAKVHGRVPPSCNCEDKVAWSKYPDHHNNAVGYNDHHLKKLRLQRSVYETAHSMLKDDRRLYEAGWERLVREAKEVHEKHGVRILCSYELPKSLGIM